MIYPPVAFKILKKKTPNANFKTTRENYHKKFAIKTGTEHGNFPPYFMKEFTKLRCNCHN